MHIPNPYPVVRLKTDARKVISCIQFLILEANKGGWRPTQYQLAKALYLADKSHLNDWGRPITFDNYVAMFHGPVPSLSYDLIKGNTYRMSQLSIRSLPWNARTVTGKIQEYFDAEPLDVDEKFSPSEVEALTSVLTAVKSLGFSALRKLTHDHEAWKNAWQEDGNSGAYDMSLSLLFDIQSTEKAKMLESYSQCQ